MGKMQQYGDSIDFGFNNKEIAASLICMNSTEEIWYNLKERFSQGKMVHASYNHSVARNFSTSEHN